MTYVHNYHPNPGAVPSGAQPTYDKTKIGVNCVPSIMDMQCNSVLDESAEASYFVTLPAGDYVWTGVVWTNGTVMPSYGWVICGDASNGGWKELGRYSGKAASNRFTIPFTLNQTTKVRFNIATPPQQGKQTNVNHQIICEKADWDVLQKLGLTHFTGDTMPLN